MSDEPPPTDTSASPVGGFLASLGVSPSTSPESRPADGTKRLTRAEEARIVRLAREDVPALRIAELVDCHHSTVYAVLEAFTPSVDDARIYMEALALPAAKTLRDTMRPGANDRVRMESATKVLETVGIAPVGDSKGHSVQVAVVIGGPSQPPDFIKP